MIYFTVGLLLQVMNVKAFLGLCRILSTSTKVIHVTTRRRHPLFPLSLSHNDSIEKRDEENRIHSYVGPTFHLEFSEFVAGTAITEHSLQVLVGPSEVALGQMGLYISLYFETMDETLKETVIAEGTPLCGYGRGYFTDQYLGDKSVGYSFEGHADSFAVFYERELVSLDSAIQRFIKKNHVSWDGQETRDIVCGHVLSLSTRSKDGILDKCMHIRPDPSFKPRIFVPEISEDTKFTVSHLGMYANDFAYDPECHLKQEYYMRSETNNVLDLAWRMTDGSPLYPMDSSELSSPNDKGKNELMLIPTWPVVKLRSNLRIVNEVPMELGLQYGFAYWDFYHKTL